MAQKNRRRENVVREAGDSDPPVPRPHFLWCLIHINKAADKTRFSVRVKAQPVHGRSPKIRVYIEQIFECF